MAGFSESLAQAIFDATLKASKTSLTAKAGAFISLHTAAPNDNSGGNEANYAGYARVDISAIMTSSLSGVAPDVSVVATNASDITFPASTGSTQTVSHWAIWDSASGALSSNQMYSGALSASRSVQTGDVVVIPAGTLAITIN